MATGIAAGDFEISVTGGGQTATLPARVATWSTTKLDNDVEPKDFHVITTSLGATPDRAGLAVAAWLVPDSTGRIGAAYREYDPATAYPEFSMSFAAHLAKAPRRIGQPRPPLSS